MSFVWNSHFTEHLMFSVAKSDDWRQEGTSVSYVVAAVFVVRPCPISSSSQMAFSVYVWRPHKASAVSSQESGSRLLALFPGSLVSLGPSQSFSLISWPAYRRTQGYLRCPHALTPPSHLCLISIFQIDMKGRGGGSHHNSLSLTQNLNQESVVPQNLLMGKFCFFLERPWLCLSIFNACLFKHSSFIPPQTWERLSPWERKMQTKSGFWIRYSSRFWV